VICHTSRATYSTLGGTKSNASERPDMNSWTWFLSDLTLLWFLSRDDCTQGWLDTVLLWLFDDYRSSFLTSQALLPSRTLHWNLSMCPRPLRGLIEHAQFILTSVNSTLANMYNEIMKVELTSSNCFWFDLSPRVIVGHTLPGILLLHLEPPRRQIHRTQLQTSSWELSFNSIDEFDP